MEIGCPKSAMSRRNIELLNQHDAILVEKRLIHKTDRIGRPGGFAGILWIAGEKTKWSRIERRLWGVAKW